MVWASFKVKFVLHRRSRDDQAQVKFSLQSLLNHVQVKQAEEPTAKSEAERRRTIFFVGECRVIDRQLIQGLGKIRVLVRAHRIDRRKHDLLGFLIARNWLGRRVIEMRDRIADLNVPDTFHSGDDIADIPDAELIFGIEPSADCSPIRPPQSRGSNA